MVAGSLSPSTEPPPATVLIFLVLTLVLTVTLRIRLLPLSAMKTFPEPSAATAYGARRQALAAAPPSPQNAAFSFPASVEIIPEGFTWRTWWLPHSAI